MKKSYNRYRSKYRWERASKHSFNGWSAMYERIEVVNQIASQGFETGNFKFRMKPYRVYWLRSFLWLSLRLIKPYQPKRRLSTQSKRHATIVGLMVVTILLAIWMIVIMVNN